jgi:hypothetical protein
MERPLGAGLCFEAQAVRQLQLTARISTGRASKPTFEKSLVERETKFTVADFINISSYSTAVRDCQAE